MCDTHPVCRNCRGEKPSRARRLCYGCYRDPVIRDQFGPVSAYGRRGVGNPRGSGRPPATPTAAPPGSAEKLAVLADRASRNELLFHPADGTYANHQGIPTPGAVPMATDMGPGRT